MKQKLFKELVIKYSRYLYDAYQHYSIMTDDVAKKNELSEFSFYKGILIGYIDSRNNIVNTEKIIKYILNLNFDIMRIFKDRDEFSSYFYEILYGGVLIFEEQIKNCFNFKSVYKEYLSKSEIDNIINNYKFVEINTNSYWINHPKYNWICICQNGTNKKIMIDRKFKIRRNPTIGEFYEKAPI